MFAAPLLVVEGMTCESKSTFVFNEHDRLTGHELFTFAVKKEHDK